MPGSAYFKLLNTIVRERSLQYGQPIYHSRHGNFPFKSLRCGLALPSTLLFLLQALKTLTTTVIIEQKNLKFCCYRNMKFENGVTRKFKEHSLSKVQVMSAFSYLIPRHHLPKSRQNRSIRRQWKLTNFKTY